MAGSRNISAGASTEAAKTSATTWNYLKVYWDGSTGTKYYSDAAYTVDGGNTTESRVTQWGEAESALNDGGEFSCRLRDNDQALREAADSEGTEQHVVELYQVWGSGDEALLWSGVTEARSRWNEGTAEYELWAVGYEHALDGPLGTVCRRADFPYAAPDEYGTVFPVVYGKVRGIEPIWAAGGGPTTTLTSGMGADDTSLYVADPTEFPDSSAGNTIKIWIGRELVEGYFDATTTNKFTITNRELTKIDSVNVSWPDADDYGSGPSCKLKLASLSGYSSGELQGYALRMRIADGYGGIAGETPEYVGPYQYRTIRRHWVSGSSEYILLDSGFSDGGPQAASYYPWVPHNWDNAPFWPWKPPAVHKDTNHAASVRYHRRPHPRGERVRYGGSDGSCTYVASDREGTAVNRVYYVGQGGSEILMPSGTYTVDSADSTYSSELGGNCTTITFAQPPENIAWSRTKTRTTAWWNGEPIQTRSSTTRRRGDNNIIVDMEGPTDGSLVEHPAKVIEHIAERAGLAAGNIDSASITNAEAEKTGYRCAFAIQRTNKRAADTLLELARLSECAIDWTEGTLRMVALDNDLEAATIAKAITTDRELDSQELGLQGIQQQVTQYEGTFRLADGRESRATVTDDTAASDVGFFSEQLDAWPYNHASPVKSMCDFWLYRKRYQPRELTQNSFLQWLDLLPGDIVTVDGDEGWIQRVRVQPGTRGQEITRITLDVMVPPARWYDDTWTSPSSVYYDPPDPSDEETGGDIGELDWDSSMPPAPVDAGYNPGSAPQPKITKVYNGGSTAMTPYDCIEVYGIHETAPLTLDARRPTSGGAPFAAIAGEDIAAGSYGYAYTYGEYLVAYSGGVSAEDEIGTQAASFDAEVVSGGGLHVIDTTTVGGDAVALVRIDTFGEGVSSDAFTVKSSLTDDTANYLAAELTSYDGTISIQTDTSADDHKTDIRAALTHLIKADSGDPTPDYLATKARYSVEVDTGAHALQLVGDESSPPARYCYSSTGSLGWNDLEALLKLLPSWGGDSVIQVPVNYKGDIRWETLVECD